MNYNGYANYETWNVCLWIDNDPGEYEYWQDRAREIAEEVRGENEADDDAAAAKADAVSRLADQLEAYYDETAPDVHGFYSDILRTALARVDWREVAETRFDDNETFVPARSATSIRG